MEQKMQKTALLVMDMQTAILRNLPDAGNLTAQAAKAIAKARSGKIPVIYVVVGFRKGLPEISGNNKSFSGGKERFAGIAPDEFLKIDPSVAPGDEEVVVTKRRVSAFTGSDLEVILRAHEIRHLVLAGCSTSGVVLSTVREAADKDYQITVLSDACADGDEEVHRILTTKVFPRQCEVLTAEAWQTV